MGEDAPMRKRHASDTGTRLFWYITAAACWSTAFSMALVLLPWLLVGELGVAAGWVGVLQSVIMIPTFLLSLFGGALADRRDRRLLLIGFFSLAGLVSLIFTALTGTVILDAGAATSAPALTLILLFAGCLGVLAAFVVPARDAMVSDISAENLMRAIVLLNIAHWGMQAVGSLLASAARWAGMLTMLLAMSLIFAAAALAIRRLPAAPPHQAGATRLAWRDLGSAVAEVWRSRELMPTFVLNFAVGAFFVGPFLVAFPVLVRDVYRGDVALLGWLNMAFPIGIILGSMAMLGRGRLRRKGLAQLLALYVGCLFLGSLALEDLPFWGALLAIVCWGGCAAVFMNAGRTVFQERASAAQRARVLAIYSIALSGATGLIGAPLSGLLVELWGAPAACAINAGIMLATVALAHLLTPVAQVE